MPTTTPAPPRRDAPAGGSRIASGTAFVLVCAALAVAFVLFLLFVSPILLQRTQALAPPPAPQVVASGQLDGRTWSATALDRNAGLGGPDEDGVEPIIEEEPCSVVDLGDGTAPAELCVTRRGGSLRGVEGVEDPAGRAVVHGIVAPQVTSVELVGGSGQVLRATPTYVDFGFPLGFFAVEVDAGTPITGVRALNRDGVERAAATCQPGEGPFGACEITEGDY